MHLIEPRMTKTYTRNFTLSVSPDSSGADLDEPKLLKLRDEAFTRLQASMFSLISQGILSGALMFQEQSQPVSIHWSITVQDQPVSQ